MSQAEATFAKYLPSAEALRRRIEADRRTLTRLEILLRAAEQLEFLNSAQTSNSVTERSVGGRKTRAAGGEATANV